jgi:hypothetical protein
VRWIVEKVFSRFNHHAALTNIRNKQVGHIMVDYRICAAMLNFTHKCNTSDVSKSKKVAKRINNRLTTYINPLSFLIKRRLDTRLIKKVKLLDIIDFPRLKQKVMETKIFFGTYQFRQSKSYMSELLESDIVYILNENLINTIQDSGFRENLAEITRNSEKLVAAEIISRHRHQIRNHNEQNSRQSDNFKNVYRVFVRYIPSLNNYKAITGTWKQI